MNYYDHFKKQMEILRTEKDSEKEIALREKEQLIEFQKEKVSQNHITIQ